MKNYISSQKRNLFLICASLICSLIYSQTLTPVVLSADGGYAFSTSGSVAWTIGEPVSETYINSNITTMGFHQPELIDIVGIKESGEQNEEISFYIFPNPVSEFVNLNFKGMPSGSYELIIVDALGKKLNAETVQLGDKIFQVNMREYAAGVYFFNITGTNTKKINQDH